MIGAPAGSGPPRLDIDGLESGWTRIGAFGETVFFRAQAALPRGDTDRTVPYRVGAACFSLIVPGARSLRIAFMSCNGQQEKTLEDTEADPHRNALWREAGAVHRESPFHLLLHGGDQLYADMVWKQVPELAAVDRIWTERKAANRELSDAALGQIRAYYHGRYMRLWTYPDIRTLLASVPSVMMWDDHDIFDGWGSHPAELANSPVYRGIFGQARDAFRLFQLAEAEGEPASGRLATTDRHFGWLYRAGPIALLAPDLRSTRTRDRVMDERTWQDVERAVDGLTDARILVLVSSMPVINLSLDWLEQMLERIGLPLLYHRRFIMDDLRDQWQSPHHADELARLIRALMRFAEAPGRSVLVLSGEVHYGAFGHADLPGGARIPQLISSGIAHPPPGGLAVAVWRLIGRIPQVKQPGVRLAMDAVPGWHRPLLNRRNWLEMEFGRGETAAFRWHADGLGGLDWAQG